MRQINDEQPPESAQPDVKQWLSQLVDEINASLTRVHDFEPVYDMPQRTFNGMVRYFGGAVLPDIPAEGLYIKLSTGWAPL